jgi:hypothetical protein
VTRASRTFQLTVVPSTPTSTTRAYRAGHWVQFNSGNDTLGGSGTAGGLALAAAPTIKGVMKRYYWNELETGNTVLTASYTLTTLINDMEWCRERNLRFIPMLVDKTFDTDSTNGANPMPVYLQNKAVTNGTGGYTCLRWDSTVVTRFKALLTAIHAQTKDLACYVALEGVAFQETSLGLTDAQMRNNGYTPTVFGDYYIDLLAFCGTLMSTKRAFWFFNFIASLDGEAGQPQIDRVINAAGDNLVFGGPDCWPTSGAGSALRSLTYPKYTTHEDDAPIFIGISVPSYEQPVTIGAASPPYMTMTNVFEYGRDTLHANYVFWMWKPQGLNNFPTHSSAVIAANPTFNVEGW